MSDPSGNSAGNLLSNVSPPSALPANLILAPAAPPLSQTGNPASESVSVASEGAAAEPHIPTKFSPAIPPSKDTSAEQTPAAEDPSANLGHLNLNPEPVSAALGPLTQSGSSLFGWVKDAASSGGGILSKVAEKAKNSVPLVEPTTPTVMINENGMVVEQTPEGEWTYDPNEPRYCICNQVSYGDMVACDNEDCPFEWFHYPCVGITQSPKGKWYCPQCTSSMRRRGSRKT
uniref:Inhibitor of growth protein 3 n=1 Tax=Phlebotomus papatasi TaxID=29031 RepID=A0A1B0DFI6_PHLPP